MDVQDGLGADGTHTLWEPPRDDEPAAAAGDPRGYDPTAPGGDEGASASGDESTPSGDSKDASTMTVEVDGRTRELPAEHDYTGDGRPDAAVETADGTVIVFADTEDNVTGADRPDGKADEAYVVDKQSGQVLRTAHVDPDSGTWVNDPATATPEQPAAPTDQAATAATAETAGRPEDGGTAGRPEDGATAGRPEDGATAGQPAGALAEAPAGADETGRSEVDAAGDGRMVVRTGERIQELPAQKDYTGDGRRDAAVETKSGQVIVFSDTADNDTGAAGPDGRADEAWIVDKATGRVVGAAHLDPETGEWVDGLDSTDPAGPESGSS
jgi:hypothetical protein